MLTGLSTSPPGAPTLDRRRRAARGVTMEDDAFIQALLPHLYGEGPREKEEENIPSCESAEAEADDSRPACAAADKGQGGASQPAPEQCLLQALTTQWRDAEELERRGQLPHAKIAWEVCHDTVHGTDIMLSHACMHMHTHSICICICICICTYICMSRCMHVKHGCVCCPVHAGMHLLLTVELTRLHASRLARHGSRTYCPTRSGELPHVFRKSSISSVRRCNSCSGSSSSKKRVSGCRHKRWSGQNGQACDYSAADASS